MPIDGFDPVSDDVEFNELPSIPSLQDRYVLTQVGRQYLSFPSQWVAEILTVERSQILSLPFYHSMFLGVIHHQGHTVPLISGDALLAEKTNRLPSSSALAMLSIVRLSQAAQHLSGVGIVVGHVIGNRSKEQLFLDGASTHLFDLEEIPDDVWCPQPWLAPPVYSETRLDKSSC